MTPTPRMTVGELMAKLRDLPPDMPVVTDGYEGGLDNPFVWRCAAYLDMRDCDMQGQHDFANQHVWEHCDHDECRHTVTEVVVIGGDAPPFGET